MARNNMLQKLKCIMGPVIHLRIKSIEVKRASIWLIVELVFGVLQTTSPRILRIATTMPIVKEMGLGKCSAPKF